MDCQWSRRRFLASAAATAGGLALGGCVSTRAVETRLQGQFPSYTDEKTGATVYNLTPGPEQDTVVYQTHPMWTPRMEYLVYMVGGVPYALEMATGTSRPLLDKPAPFSMQWNSGNLFYLQGRDLCRMDVVQAFQEKGKPEKLAPLPDEYLQSEGGLSVDAGGDVVYTGVLLEKDKKWGVAGCDRDGWHTLTTFDFHVGHIQANPYVPGRVMFCWETGGDAPQRTWVAEGKNPTARPAYKETFNEWVTHEVWWGPDRMVFTIWPYDDAHKKLPHGVAWSRVESGELNILAQYPAWHTHGSPDGRWVLGDDFDRNIWLIDFATKERRLLTQGHLGKGCKTHPHSSFTPDSGAVVLNSSRGGNDDILLVPIPEWESLPKA